MPKTITTIDTEELLLKLQKSGLTEGQKTKLTQHMSKLSEKEKEELGEILEQESNLRTKFEQKKASMINGLNQKTTEKMNVLSHNTDRKIREEHEAFDQTQSESELEKVEENLNETPKESPEKNEDEMVELKIANKKHKPSKHLALKFILIVMGLATIASLIMIGLNNM